MRATLISVIFSLVILSCNEFDNAKSDKAIKQTINTCTKAVISLSNSKKVSYRKPENTVDLAIIWTTKLIPL